MEKRSKSANKKNKMNHKQQQQQPKEQQQCNGLTTSSETGINGNPITASNNSIDISTSPNSLIINSSPKTYPPSEEPKESLVNLQENGKEEEDETIIATTNALNNITSCLRCEDSCKDVSAGEEIDNESDKNTSTTNNTTRLKNSNGISITQHISKNNNNNNNTSPVSLNSNNSSSSSSSHDSLTEYSEEGKLTLEQRGHDSSDGSDKHTKEQVVDKQLNQNECCNGLNDDTNEVVQQHERLSPTSTTNVKANTEKTDKDKEETGDEKEATETSDSHEQSSQNNVSLAISAGYLVNEVNEYGIRYVSYDSELQMSSIMKLIQKDLSEPYSVYTYRYFIHNWPSLCFLAMDGDNMVGVIVCKLDLHKQINKRGYIAMLAVDEKYRRKKIGSSLVLRSIRAMAEEDADEIVLETEITNQSALRLYENLGFVRDKRLFRYYLNGVDALRLKLWLK